MKNYILYAVKDGTSGLDTEVNLSFEITSKDAPVRLVDFSGGRAELYDGYSAQTYKYSIGLVDYDERRIFLNNGVNRDIVISPDFIRRIDKNDPLNQLVEIPLKLGQNLSGYKITHSNWGLR